MSRALVPVILLAVLCQCTGCQDVPLDVDGAYPVDASTVVTLERTSCYGTCPSYFLTISGDGNVSYLGRKYVKVVGSASTRIAVSDVRRLVGMMMAADYFGLSVRDDCPDGISTDNPTATTSLTWGGQTHTVENYHGNPCAPAVLRTIENQVDVTAKSSQWVECGANDPTCDN